MSKSYASNKKNFILTVAASFMGILAAIPVTLALYAPSDRAAAIQDQASTSTAMVSKVPADFEQFAYAYNQGYVARAASISSVGGVETCSEAVVSEDGAVATSGEAVARRIVATKPLSKSSQGAVRTDRVASIVNSYNSYQSIVQNSSSSTTNNTNSNNTLGSNNSNRTEVNIDDAKGVLLGINNETNVTSISNADSFNKDSYNTKTDTKIINDSFNEEKTLIIDSGNTTTNTKNVAVNKTEIADSYNTKNVDVDKTEIDDSYNTEIKTETKTETEITNVTKTDDSYNNTKTNIEADIEVDL